LTDNGHRCAYFILPPARESDPPPSVGAVVAVARGVLGWICLVGFVLGLFLAQLLFS
jgi:hypothetical protein